MPTAFFTGVGPLELLIVLLIVLVIVGGRRLPALGRQLATGMRGFKDSVTGPQRVRVDDDDGGRAKPGPRWAAPPAKRRRSTARSSRERP